MNEDKSNLAILELPKLEAYSFTKPTAKDGANMWKLVYASGALDINSSYSYLMMCKYFTNTCVVAKYKEEFAGFVTGFRLPEKNDTLFIWQIGVAQEHRGKGLATKMMFELLKRRELRDIAFIEATITPSNEPSASLFQGVAKKLRTTCTVTNCFATELFPEESHESERLYRIGPIQN